MVVGGGHRRQLFTRRAHGESGGLDGHVKLRGKLERPELLQLSLQSPVLFRQILATTLKKFTVHFRLLQLGSANDD